MRVVCDVFSINLPRHWRQLPTDQYCLRIGNEGPLDVYFKFSWQSLPSPLSSFCIAKMLIDSISHSPSLAASSCRFNATVVLVDRGRLKYAYFDTRRKGRFFRCWNIHDGTYMAYVNYSSKLDGHEAGLAEADQIVKSLRFLPIPVES